ncbi:MAG: alanine--tRNA ligase [Armatimonadetes bacterium]|nr:alanine--tRNA ligase [Armatimonadota bacterium]
MNARELRRKFVDFFESKGHTRHDSAPLIPIDVTGKLDESLLFTGAGMVQFKPYFRGIAQPPSRRLVNSQKCVRTVDIEDVGNPSHLTFFEMLGNFSFGDYFKEGAIEYAWELLTSPEWLGIDPKKLCVTVFNEDDEAYDLWARVWRNAGFKAEDKIHRLDEHANFWPAGALTNGPPGPCGPCSEIFYQTVPDSEMAGNYEHDERAARWLEIWNLVFMEFEWRGHLKDPTKPHLGYARDGLDPLPQKGIDTGSGLERTASVLGDMPSVYQTDVFTPIMEEISARAGYELGSDGNKEAAARIIADHARTACMCVADGVLPSNSGPGYVLRRLIRRAILKGDRILELKTQFFSDLAKSVEKALGDYYLDLSERRELIERTLQSEEALFRSGMADGVARFETLLKSGGKVTGAEAFFLYDTFGFPLEVTQELAAEHGLTIDLDEYNEHLADAQERSRAAQGSASLFAETLLLSAAPNAPTFTRFVGYGTDRHRANLVQISPRFDEAGLTTGRFQACLDETPFYAESGGQVGDTGTISNDTFEFTVTDTWKELGQIWHDANLVRFEAGDVKGLNREAIQKLMQSGAFFSPVEAAVDSARLRDITRNHTATHLLHATLREVLGNHVTQAGSLVAPDRLRFDFTHAQAMTPDEIAHVEDLVNRKIAESTAVSIHPDVPLAEARKRGAMMLFGEKYGDKVRMVEIDNFSLELCGGIHVARTAEIGLFKITGESSSAGGVRRIEAVTGFGAYRWAHDRENLIKETAALLKSNPNDMPKAAERLQAQLREAKKIQGDARKRDVDPSSVEPKVVGAVRLYAQSVTSGDVEAGKLLADRLIEKDAAGVGLVAVSGNGRVTFICKVGKEAMRGGAHAGNLVREVAKIAGGGGGGSPEFAQAGGKDPSKVDAALEAAAGVLAQQTTGS